MIEFDDVDDSISMAAYFNLPVAEVSKIEPTLEIPSDASPTMVDTQDRLRSETISQNNLLEILSSHSEEVETSDPMNREDWWRPVIPYSPGPLDPSEELLLKRIDCANLLINDGFYTEALASLDQLYDEIDQTKIVPLLNCMIEFTRASRKLICLALLGRSEEALEQANLALKEAKQIPITSALERLSIIQFWKELNEKYPDVEGDEDVKDLAKEEAEINRKIEQGFEQTNEERETLLLRGFIHLSLQNKEQAILDLRPFFSIGSSTSTGLILMGKILEKKLDAQILSWESDDLKDYELLLLQGNYEEALKFYSELSHHDWYPEKVLCYAMLGQFDKAFEFCHLAIEADDEQVSESMLHLLKGEYEIAKNGLSEAHPFERLFIHACR